MTRILAAALFCTLSLTACAQSYQPVVDTGRTGGTSNDTGRYQQDLFECRQHAERVSPAEDTLIGGAGGAAAGAALGAISGALLGGFGAGEGAAFGAAAGGLLGVGGGAISGISNQQEIIDRCLAGRGWNVLK